MSGSLMARQLVVAALTCSALPAAGHQDPLRQNPPSTQPPIDASTAQVFRTRADMVVLHVNVFDEDFNDVPELAQDNFLVFEDGRNQQITFFSREDVPVAAGLVIDNSSSMITRSKMVVAGGMAFADSSHPEDELYTVYFNEHVRLGLPSSLAFTPSRPLLRSALSSLHAGGKTALHDAVIAALDHVAHATHQKHVIIVLSDGEDNASRHTRDEMYDRAMKSDAIIYAVIISDPRTGGDGDPGVLRRLAGIGGGVAYRPKRDDEVVAAFKEIADNIRRGYSIGYTPTNMARDGGYRRVKVMVRAKGRSWDARCRDGYTAPGETSAR